MTLPMQTSDVSELKETAKRLREKILRMTAEAGSGHPSSSLSSVRSSHRVALLPDALGRRERGWEERDRFVLSKGHGVPVSLRRVRRRRVR